MTHLDIDGGPLCGINFYDSKTTDPSAVTCPMCSLISRNRPRTHPEECNHLGRYNLYTRNIGYSNVRVYDCQSCGAQLAMDTLPQSLLKRMWGEPERTVVRQSLIDVDLCVTINGLNALPLSRIFLWSLQQTTNLCGVNLHLINIDLSNEEFSRIVAMAPKCKTYQRSPSVIGRPGGDAAWSCEWIMEKCGNKQFVVLSHFDLFFIRDFLTCLRKDVTQRTGMLGQHCPFWLVNREAYANTRMGFDYMGGLYAQPVPNQPKQCYLYYHGDPRITSDAMSIPIDLGEWLELEMRWKGYHCDPMRDRFGEYFYHFVGGSRVRKGDEFVYTQERARMFIEEYNIP